MSLPPDLPPPPPLPPPKPRPPFPTWMQAVALCGILMVLSLGVGVAVSLPWVVYGVVTTGEPIQPPLIVLAVGNCVAYSLVFVVAVFWGRRSLRDFFPFRRVRLGLFVPMGISVVGLGILCSELANLVDYVLPAPDWLMELFSGLVENPLQGIITVVIVAPLTEELLFRGIILKGFLDNYRSWSAILLSSLLFGIIHLNPYQFGSAVILGVLFAWWRLRTQSLWPSLFGHALNNGTPFLLAYGLQLEVPGYTTVTETDRFQPLWFDGLGLALAVAGVWWFKAMLDRSAAPRLDWPAAGE